MFTLYLIYFIQSVIGTQTGLFIWGTGRSGSTTILEMLNQVPCISLSGENGDFMKDMDSLSSYMMYLNHRNGAWFNEIDEVLRDRAEELLIQSLTMNHQAFWGFKEIRTERIPMIVKLVPNDLPIPTGLHWAPQVHKEP